MPSSTPDLPQYHFAKFAAARDWYDQYFLGIREFPRDSTCFEPEAVEVEGLKLGVLGINSALFALEGENLDYGKLWIGRRPLDKATQSLDALGADVTVSLLHHPIDWLHDEERSNIKTKMRSTVDFILRGHLHESDIDQIVSSSGGAMHIAAGAANQTRRYPNRALYVDLDYEAASVRILPIRYEDKPQEIWVVDPSLYPTKPGYEGSYSVQWKKTAVKGEPRRRTVSPRATPTIQPTGFIACDGFQDASTLSLVGCVVVQDADRLRERIERVREDLLHDPYLIGLPNVEARLRRRGFEYGSDDPEVRSKFIERLAGLPFEAYICFAKNDFFAGADPLARFERLLGRLLFERLRAERQGPLHLRLSRRLADRLGTTTNVAGAVARDIEASSTRALLTMPEVTIADEREPCVAVVDYVCGLVHARLDSPGSIQARGFQRVATKVRVIHDLEKDRFFTRKNPLP